VSRESLALFEDREQAPILHDEIERLPAKYRAPIVLCYLEGMTHDQAAVELGWPVGTVRGRLSRARDLLRSRLTSRGMAVSAGLVASGALAEAAAVGLPAALVETTVRAAIGGSAAGGLSRGAALLLKAILRDMAVARMIRLVAPLAIIAGLAGGAGVLLDARAARLAGRRRPVAMAVPAARPTPIDLAGDPLPDGALARLGTTRFSPGATIVDIAYSPDGRILASTDRDGELELWDAATGRRRLAIVLDEKDVVNARIQGMAFAPDGRTIAVRSISTTILYETESGRPIRRFEEKSQRHQQNAQPLSLAFSPDGSILAASFFDAPIALWEVGTGRRIRAFDAGSKQLFNLTFTPDGKILLSILNSEAYGPAFAGDKSEGPEPSLIQVWDVAAGREIRRIGLGKTAVGDTALAPDGKTLAVATIGRHGRDPQGKSFFDATAPRGIRLFELATGREVRRIGGSEAIPRGLSFTSDGTRLATGEETFNPASEIDHFPRTTVLHLWDVATGRDVRRWEARSRTTSSLSFAPDDQTLAWVGGDEHVIRFWDAATGREVRPQPGHRGAIGDAAFTPDGRSLVTVSEDRTLRFWDPAAGIETRQIEASDDRIWFAALSADGKTLATGGGFRPARLWDVASGREIRAFSIPGEQFTWSGDLSPDGRTLATSESNSVIFWDTETGRRQAAKGRPTSRFEDHMIKSLRFAPDGKSVATLGGDWIRFWDVAKAEETRRFALPNSGPLEGFMLDGARIAFSPDGTTLAATSQRDGRIFLLDAATGRERDRLDGPENQFKALAFSADGRILATGADNGRRVGRRDQAIRLWDVAGRKELGRVPAHRSYIRALAFSADGRRIVSASEDGTALVWDMARIVGRRTGDVAP
jgi:WD40 repeat protein